MPPLGQNASKGNWTVTAHDILSQEELDLVVADLQRRARRSKQTLCSLALFRLAAYCGLRASELIGLRVGDLQLASSKPAVRVPAAIAKGKKGRKVPIWFQSAVADIEAWRDYRMEMGADNAAPLLCSVHADVAGKPRTRQGARHRFRQSCKVLGPDRSNQVTTHTGRHTFASMCLAKGKAIAAVCDACGHSSISVTNVYAHLFEVDSEIGWFINEERVLQES